MKSISIVLGVLLCGLTRAGDLTALAPNTWVSVKHTVQQPAGGEKGDYAPAGWNKLIYDAAGKRVLFYDRWSDKKHGGATIYGNCLFSFDPLKSVLAPLKIDNWLKVDRDGGYRTLELPENSKEPTPCSRHVYSGFEYIPDQNAVFLCNGANGTAMRNEKLECHLLTANMWKLDLGKGAATWSQVAPEQHPTKESLDDAMAYCPDTKSLILTMKGQIWIYDLTANKWRKSKHNAPTGGAGQTICYDPVRKRMLLSGGTSSDFSVAMPDRAQKDKTCNKLYAFDPRTETFTKLADMPTGLYECNLAYDSKHDVFMFACTMQYKDMPAGTFCYDPKKDQWSEVKTANSVPASGNWYGWIRMCYDSDLDCFVGLVIYDQFCAFKYVPEALPAITAQRK
jgi:hypothetical protein